MTTDLLKKWYVRYGLAVTAAFAGFSLRLALTHWVGPDLPTYITFYPVVMLVALLGGVGPGVATTAAVALITDYWILPPTGSFHIEALHDAVALVFFTGVGVFMSVVAGRYRNIRGNLEALVATRTRELKDANSVLKQQMELMHQATDALIVCEMDGAIRFWNRGAEALYGWTASEALGRCIHVLLRTKGLHPDHMSHLQQNGHWEGEIQHTTRAGRLVFVEGRKTAIRADGGKLLVLESLRDITGRKKEEEAAAQVARAQSAADTIRAMRDGVMLLDLDGTIISVNPAVERMTGRTGGALVGRNLESLLPALTNETDLETARHGLTILRGGVIPDLPSLQLRRPDGKTVHILPSVSLINAPTGLRQMAVLTFKDVTDQREAAQRVRDLTQRLAVAEEEDRWRISRYIHDTVIQTLSLSNIRMGSMVKPLHDANLKEEAGKLERIRELLSQAIDECRLVMSDLTPALLYELGLIPALNELAQRLEAKHGARIVVEADGDGQEKPIPNALRGLLFESTRELIMNALKHAGPCEIRVVVNVSAHDLVIRVADNGQGFDPSVARHANRHGGFGLFNIHQRVDGLGGRLEIDSAPGKGTTATLRVPMGAEENGP